jgi:hypothetical protein
LNYAIKSVTDNAFIDSKENSLKEKALIQLYKNLSSNLSDTYKRWREINNIDKIRERLSNSQKEQMLKVLDQLLHSSKQLQVREIIQKFRLNRRVTEIQRNFLKRLLMSRAGLVVIAFRKIQTLPERKDNENYVKATKFEKGLSLFVEKTLRGSFVPFKNEYEEGQAYKKRAVIQLINTTAGGQKRLFNRWLNITDKTKMMNECR